MLLYLHVHLSGVMAEHTSSATFLTPQRWAGGGWYGAPPADVAAGHVGAALASKSRTTGGRARAGIERGPSVWEGPGCWLLLGEIRLDEAIAVLYFEV